MSSGGKASYVVLQSVANLRRLLVIVLAAASLAACAQSAVVTRKSEFSAASRPASPHHERPVAFLANRPAAVTSRPPFVPPRTTAETPVASQGLASFYTEGTRTANGETFNTHELTAAHRTLPFGTRLRVTNVATGRSVTVRVNDRGPYVPGRIVDVSYSAAESLGMVGRGIAKVKLDVVR
jgi:rare lipoprotein A